MITRRCKTCGLDRPIAWFRDRDDRTCRKCRQSKPAPRPSTRHGATIERAAPSLGWRNCRQCHLSNPAEAFVDGRDVCHACHADNQALKVNRRPAKCLTTGGRYDWKER